MSTIIGVNGIPLSYVLREKDNPDANGGFHRFIENTIECETLKGDYYEADHHTVNQALVSFTTGNP